MRLILGIVFFLCSMAICLGAYAGNRYEVSPKIAGHSVRELCDAGATFNTLKPVLSCTSWNLEDVIYDQTIAKEWNCKSQVTAVKSISKLHLPKACDQSSTPDCETTVEPRLHGNVFLIPVYEDDAVMGPTPVGQIEFTIPACN